MAYNDLITFLDTENADIKDNAREVLSDNSGLSAFDTARFNSLYQINDMVEDAGEDTGKIEEYLLQHIYNLTGNLGHALYDSLTGAQIEYGMLNTFVYAHRALKG